MARREIGGLECRVVDVLPDGVRPELAVVLCHGFGAPADDLVPLAESLLRTRPNLSAVRFYMPAAMLDLGPRGMPDGRAWWWLDLDRLARSGPDDRLAGLRESVPDGLPAARERLVAMIEEVRHATGLPPSQIVLGGFSQGAMLATDVALRLAEPPAAVGVWSGNLLCEAEWRTFAERFPAVRFLVSHGRHDPLLPFAGAAALRDLLTAAGHEVNFLPFDGGHGVPPAALAAFADLLTDLLGGA